MHSDDVTLSHVKDGETKEWSNIKHGCYRRQLIHRLHVFAEEVNCREWHEYRKRWEQSYVNSLYMLESLH